MGKVTDSVHGDKRLIDGRRLRDKATPRPQRTGRTGPHRAQELEELYEEFRRNKSVDL